MKAIRFSKPGGPEVLTLEDIELPPPGPGQVRVRHTVIGVNFIDTYHRSGLYPVPLPSGLGLEAAGVVEALGANVTSLKIGDRVGLLLGPLGAYAEANNVAADRVVKLPHRDQRRSRRRLTAQGHDGAISPQAHLPRRSAAKRSCSTPRQAAWA